MIRVLHLAGSSGFGGVETFIECLGEHLDRQEFEIVVCILDTEGPLVDRLRKMGVTVVPIGTGVRAVLRFIRIVRAGRFQLLHANTGGRLYRTLARSLGLRRSIVHIHGPSEPWAPITPRNGHEFRSALRKSVSGASKIVVCARWLARSIISAKITDLPPIQVIHYGVATPPHSRRIALRANRRVSNVTTIVGFVGRLTEQKGIADLAEIVLRVAAARELVEFWIIGDGPLRSSLNNARSTIGSDRMWLTGAHEKAADILPAMDIVVIPSHWEGLSIIHLEAMAAGKAIVGYAIEGLVEAAIPGETGIYVPPRDLDAFVSATCKLIDDPTLRTQLGKAAAEKAASEFQVRRMVREIEDLYSEVATR